MGNMKPELLITKFYFHVSAPERGGCHLEEDPGCRIVQETREEDDEMVQEEEQSRHGSPTGML